MKRWTLIALALLIAAGAWLAGATMGPYAMSKEPRFPQLTMEQLSEGQKPLAEQIVKVSSVSHSADRIIRCCAARCSGSAVSIYSTICAGRRRCRCGSTSSRS